MNSSVFCKLSSALLSPAAPMMGCSENESLGTHEDSHSDRDKTGWLEYWLQIFRRQHPHRNEPPTMS